MSARVRSMEMAEKSAEALSAKAMVKWAEENKEWIESVRPRGTVLILAIDGKTKLYAGYAWDRGTWLKGEAMKQSLSRVWDDDPQGRVILSYWRDGEMVITGEHPPLEDEPNLTFFVKVEIERWASRVTTQVAQVR